MAIEIQSGSGAEEAVLAAMDRAGFSGIIARNPGIAPRQILARCRRCEEHLDVELSPPWPRSSRSSQEMVRQLKAYLSEIAAHFHGHQAADKTITREQMLHEIARAFRATKRPDEAEAFIRAAEGLIPAEAK